MKKNFWFSCSSRFIPITFFSLFKYNVKTVVSRRLEILGGESNIGQLEEDLWEQQNNRTTVDYRANGFTKRMSY